jgi:hypothetical protein
MAIVSGPLDYVWLDPGESVEWGVTCTPQTFGTTWGELSFDDSSESDYHFVDISCLGLGAHLTGYSPFSFGAVPIGGSGVHHVHVTNVGNIATELTALASDNPVFTAALHAGSLPVTVEPGAEVVVDVTFSPTDTTLQSGTVT